MWVCVCGGWHPVCALPTLLLPNSGSVIVCDIFSVYVTLLGTPTAADADVAKTQQGKASSSTRDAADSSGTKSEKKKRRESKGGQSIEDAAQGKSTNRGNAPRDRKYSDNKVSFLSSIVLTND